MTARKPTPQRSSDRSKKSLEERRLELEILRLDVELQGKKTDGRRVDNERIERLLDVVEYLQDQQCSSSG